MWGRDSCVFEAEVVFFFFIFETPGKWILYHHKDFQSKVNLQIYKFLSHKDNSSGYRNYSYREDSDLSSWVF